MNAPRFDEPSAAFDILSMSNRLEKYRSWLYSIPSEYCAVVSRRLVAVASATHLKRDRAAASCSETAPTVHAHHSRP
jgi:hypothetical protein